MNKKIISTAVSAVVLSMSGVVFADTTEDLVNALVTKGVLTEEEGNLLSKGHDRLKRIPLSLKAKAVNSLLKVLTKKMSLH